MFFVMQNVSSRTFSPSLALAEEAPGTQQFTPFQFLKWTETHTEQCDRRTWVSWASAKTGPHVWMVPL